MSLTLFTCLTQGRIEERPWEIGQADTHGLYPVHYAAMNENETGPSILEAILAANRFAAQQRDRFGERTDIHA